MRTNWHSIREFEAFRAVVDAGTATSAARRLGISQSAVSRALAHLEGRMGLTLFERVSGRLSPTAEAMRLNQRLDQLFEALSHLDGAPWLEPEEQHLRVAAPASIAHRYLVSRIASFVRMDRRRRISLEICSSEEVIPGVREDRFDVGVSNTPTAHSGVSLVPFRRAYTHCVVLKTHPLAERTEVRPEDFDGMDVVAIARRHASRVKLDQVFSAAGVKPRILVETATMVSATELARSGLGPALMNPFPVMREDQPDLAVLPFEPRIEHLTSFVLSADRPPSNLTRAFQRHLRMTTMDDLYSQAM